ncbi:MAG: peptide synthase [Planctomycetota bacterium]|nr:MAG: peptide synthase [Planctomycetota bacterium]
MTETLAPSAASSARLNIAHHLPRQADERPHQRALVVARGRGRDGRTAYAQLTFAQLDALTDRTAHALRSTGVEPGDRVLILVRPGFELIASIYAVFKIGAVAVFIDPGMGLGPLARCVERIAPRWFIGVSRAHLALTLFGRRALRTVRGRFLVGGGPGLGAIDLDALAAACPPTPFPLAPTRADDTAAVLFTSGSTGPAKGVVYEHGMFDAQVRQLRAVYGIEPGEVDLPGLPIFALFSVALGATTVFPDMDPTRPAALDPARWVEFVQDHGVTYSFGSPAIWRRVVRHCQARGLQLPSLRRVLMAGAPVPPWLHEALLADVLAPGADTHTPYGATEALPVASITGRDLADSFARTRRGEGICVGQPLPEVEVRIIAVDDGPLASFDDARLLPPGERGEVVVHGPTVTKAYCELPEATATAKLRDGKGRVWHRMGDVGCLDEDGRLWFFGRKAHRVVTGSETLYPVAVEAIFDEHPRVFRSALIGLGDRPAQRPAVVVQPEEGAFPVSRAARAAFCEELRALGARFPHTAEIERFFFHRAFPVDLRHNAKIRRGELAAWAARQG